MQANKNRNYFVIPPPHTSCLSGDFRQRAFVLDLYWRFPQWEDIRDILVNVNYLVFVTEDSICF